MSRPFFLIVLMASTVLLSCGGDSGGGNGCPIEATVSDGSQILIEPACGPASQISSLALDGVFDSWLIDFPLQSNEDDSQRLTLSMQVQKGLAPGNAQVVAPSGEGISLPGYMTVPDLQPQQVVMVLKLETRLPGFSDAWMLEVAYEARGGAIYIEDVDIQYDAGRPFNTPISLSASFDLEFDLVHGYDFGSGPEAAPEKVRVSGHLDR